jgi:hypothetical protein
MVGYDQVVWPTSTTALPGGEAAAGSRAEATFQHLS